MGSQLNYIQSLSSVGSLSTDRGLPCCNWCERDLALQDLRHTLTRDCSASPKYVHHKHKQQVGRYTAFGHVFSFVASELDAS